MTRAIERRLIDGVWVTGDFEEGGNGGSQPERNVGQAEFLFAEDRDSGSSELRAALTYLSGDTDLVDLTDPRYPKPVEAGIYSLLAQVGTDPSPTNQWYVNIVFDDDYYSVQPTQSMTGGGSSSCALAIPGWFCTALSPFFLRLAAPSDPSAIAFSGSVYIQKIA